MTFADIAKKVTSLGAPLLGSLLGGPSGGALGVAVANLFGASSDDPETLIQKMNTDPNAADKLIKLQEFEVQKLQMQLADVANARQREIEISKLPIENRDKTPSLLSKIFIGGYFFLATLIIIAIWAGNVTHDELDPIIQILKDMGLAVMLILAYWFGASNKRG